MVGGTADGATSRRWSPTSLDRPSVAGYVANVRDITERKEFEALLAHRACTTRSPDWPTASSSWTGPSRCWSRSDGPDDPVAALLHRPRQLQGRQRLARTRGRGQAPAGGGRPARAMLRASDTVGRLGGDEFVVLAEGISLARGPRTRRRTHPRGPPGAVRGRRLRGPPHHGDGQYRHRHRRPRRRPRSCSATPTSRSTGPRRQGQGRLRHVRAGHAVGRRRPPGAQVGPRHRSGHRPVLPSLPAHLRSLRDARIRGVEALIRWRHPTRGVIPPDDFIPVLEESGMIVDVGRWVLHARPAPRPPSGDRLRAPRSACRSTSRCASSSRTALVDHVMRGPGRQSGLDRRS
jgi:hypothetical protein